MCGQRSFLGECFFVAAASSDYVFAAQSFLFEPVLMCAACRYMLVDLILTAVQQKQIQNW